MSDQEAASKTDAEWRQQLTDEQFRVTRKKGTERAFSGELYSESRSGEYHCVCCDALLFTSDHKFDSGTGWPSFYDLPEGARIATETDRSWFMTRTEVLCSRCRAHLGHVFGDGPQPTGLRYCINSVAMTFEPDNQREESSAENAPHAVSNDDSTSGSSD